MYEHNALGYRSGLALCLTKVRSSRARCPATAFITTYITYGHVALMRIFGFSSTCILSQTYNATRLWHVFRILMLRKTVYPTYDGQQSPMNKLGTKVFAF